MRAARPQPRQRRFELQRFVHRFAHELLDDGFAPRAEGALAEPAAESLDAGDADAQYFVRVPIEDRHPGVSENLTYFVTFTRFDIVITEHGNDRYANARDLPRQDAGFFGQTVVGQIAGNQQEISRLGRLHEKRLKRALRCFGAMQVGDRGHTYGVRHPGVSYKS